MFVIARAGAVGADTALLRDETAKQEKTIKDLETQLAAIKTAQSQAVLTNEDRQALDDARILINQRSLSWSVLFDQLEPYVPAGAKLTSIIMTGLEGEGNQRVVSIEISGVGKQYDQMAIFISNLDGSAGRFEAEPSVISPIEDSDEFTFTILVRYRLGSRQPAEVVNNG